MTLSASPARPSRSPALLRAKTWRAFGYHWISVLLAPLALTYAVTAVSLGAGLLVTWAGLVIPAAMIIGARGWGKLNRGMVRNLLGTELPAPLPFAPRPGFVGFLRSGLTDAAGWRALAHMVLSFITSMTFAVLSITWLITALGGLTHWFWYRYLPMQQASDGSWHRGSQVFPDVYADTAQWQWIFAGAGLLLLLIWPSINNGTARVQVLLAAALLTPTASSLRVRQLEQSRSASVDDADSRLRRIERDLHDGTQAQLVAIAMKVGDVRERLSSEKASPEILSLLDSATGTAKEALTDLRGLARGIRPAALEDGLDTALVTLAAGSALPATVSCELARRPDPAVEAIAYFCASELVNNAVKHSGGTAIEITVAGQDDDALLLSVTDNGHGGAAISRRTAAGTRTGLAGLQERIGSVDGRLDIDSPAGGPTRISVELPLSSKA